MLHRLHVSFYGFSYVPKGAQIPECGASQANVTEDIQLISQLTSALRFERISFYRFHFTNNLTIAHFLARLRMYGSACNQSQLVLQAIQETKANMTVWLGIYIGTDETVNQEQMTETLAAIKAYGTKHISGVIVGNEYVLDASREDIGTDNTRGGRYILNAANNATATTYLIAKMALVSHDTHVSWHPGLLTFFSPSSSVLSWQL